MGKRKPPKATRSTRSSTPPQAGTAHKLRQLSEDEALGAYQTARKAKKLYEPLKLRLAWWRWRYNHNLPGFVADLRDLINDRPLDDPSLVTGHLARFIELIVVRFERLVEAGQFDPALPRLTALPLLYSPQAGKGALQWKKAKTLYEDKKVGTQALLEHRGRDPQTARNPVWGELAEVAARIVRQAAVELPLEILPHRKRAGAFRTFEKKRPGAKKTLQFTLYLLDGDDVLIWSGWLELRQGLPERVSDNPTVTSQAVKAVLAEFFADPANRFADDVLKTLLESPSGYSRAEAVKQAIKNVLACIERF